MQAPLTYLQDQMRAALVSAFGEQLAQTDPLLVPASNPKFGDYQANVALSLAKVLGQQPRAIAEQIVAHLDVAALCEPPSLAGPGFINFQLRPSYLAEQLQQMLGDPALGYCDLVRALAGDC
jgi:arginyl-tRNA synthetase